jgi:hypothetical protein
VETPEIQGGSLGKVYLSRDLNEIFGGFDLYEYENNTRRSL